jgi:PAS domain S-box-containing protein
MKMLDSIPISDSPHTAAILRWVDQHATDGVVTTDANLLVCSWNQWMASTTGLAPEDVIGHSLLEVFPSLADRGLDRRYAEALQGGVQVLSQRLHRFVFPTARTAAAPEQMLQSGRIAPLYDGTLIVGTITVIEDCTERLSTERELRAQIATAETALATAEVASRVKDEFLATLSHEIRTPLNAVLGWARILLERDDPDVALVRRAMDVIDRNARAQLTLIGDLLDMARISAGKVRLDVVPIDFTALVLAAIDVVRPAADSKGVRLSADLAPQLPPLVGDADRLQQVVWNLLSNAVKFTDAGGQVTVGLAVNGSTTRLTVTDTGHGIAPAFLPSVFERFKQADASSSRRHGGLGIGLALVKDLVEMHGGTVGVASEGPGLGTTFTVVLPSRASAGMAVQAETPVNESHVTRSLSGVRVVIVDDDEDAVEILMRTLMDAGAVVAAVSSAAEALTTISTVNDEERPHVVVAEVGPPAEDGYALLRQVRALPARLGGRLPAVAVSAFATTQDRKRSLQAGFRDHIAKPFTPQLLLAAIANAVAAGPPERREPARNPRNRKRPTE